MKSRYARPGAASVLLAGMLSFGCQRVPQTMPAGPAQNPLPQLEQPRSPSVLTGTVAEVVPAGSYFYARIQTPTGEAHWIASLGARPQLGGAVSARVIGTQRNFFSRRLGRRFPTVAFALLRTQ